MAINDRDSFQYRRFPALFRKVSEINPENDIRVRILGKVIDSANGVVVVDDGTGKAEIVAEDGASVGAGSVAMFFCRVMPLETGYELRMELVQDMGGLDMDLYKKIRG